MLNFVYIFILQKSGSDVHALGARMRMQRAMVGAMRQVLTGVSMRCGAVPAPKMKMGNWV